MIEASEVGNKLAREEYDELVPALRVELLELQRRLRESDSSFVLVIDGDDRIGRNEVLTVLHEWMDPRYIAAHAFRPSAERERCLPNMWRYWQALPARGRTSMFSFSWTQRVIVDEIEGKGDTERSLRHVRVFEKQLIDDGTLVLKIFLHLPLHEHARRVKKAKKDPDKHWQITDRDRVVLDHLDEAIPIADRVLAETSTGEAPWEIVESTDDHYRNLTVGRLVARALRRHLDEARPAAEAAPPAPAEEAGPSLLDKVDLTASLGKREYRERLREGQARLSRLFAQASQANISSVLALEGWDAAGKGGAIRRVIHALNAADVRIVPIAAPTPDEQQYHYLWRFWNRLPKAGRLVVFDRTWYGRVLVERVEGYAREDEWRRAYYEINDFEEQLTECGIVHLKYWLHISAEEQLRRFQEREKTPYKRFKITDEDYRNREKRPLYEQAVDDMVLRTNTPHAPWELVSAEDKRWARVRVLETFADALEQRLDAR